MQTAAYILLGYLSGSILYARVFARLCGKEDVIECSRDKNPGTANAFMYGGFLCGLLTLICDIGKSFVPVYFAYHAMDRVMQEYFEEHHVDIVLMPHLFPAEILTNMKLHGMQIPKTMTTAE